VTYLGLKLDMRSMLVCLLRRSGIFAVRSLVRNRARGMPPCENLEMDNLKPFTPNDLAEAHDLSRAVRWPHTRDDWRLLSEVGEGIAARREGRLVGTILWWRYGGQQARIGMVIVDPGIQRSGLGRRLMGEALARIDEPSIFLTATSAGGPLYRSLGFEPVGHIRQFQGIAKAPPPDALPPVRTARRDDLAAIFDCDAHAIGADRRAVVTALASVGDAAVVAGAGGLEGFAFCRLFGRGRLIGPLAAQNLDTARALVAHWAGVHAGSFLRLDMPVGSGLEPALASCGLAMVDEVTTMVRGRRPAAHAFKTFALANQALG
jgi:GNAT superfamily N-acetyltransferase